MKKRALVCLIASVILSSCAINSDILFRDTKEFEYDIPYEYGSPEYKLAPNDVISFRLYTNDGFTLIQTLAGQGGAQNGAQQNMMNNSQNGRSNGFPFLIKQDGMVELPVIGEVKIAGLTLRETEKVLEDRFREYFVKPYVILNVNNNRVIVSTGGGSSASVVNLVNNNTTLLEVIAMAGGINQRGRADRIKVIRKIGTEREVYNIDLSTVDGLRDADMVMQANDIIYIQPRPQYAKELITEIGPYLSLLSTAILVYTLIISNK